MSATRQRKKKKPDHIEKEWYHIEVDDWEVYYHFGIAMRGFEDGAYWETSNLSLTGKIQAPALKNTSRAKIDIIADPKQDDYWSREPTILSAKTIGFVEMPRGEETLIFYCYVPSRLSYNIHVAVATGKIKYVLISGAKLKWRRESLQVYHCQQRPKNGNEVVNGCVVD